MGTFAVNRVLLNLTCYIYQESLISKLNANLFRDLQKGVKQVWWPKDTSSNREHSMDL